MEALQKTGSDSRVTPCGEIPILIPFKRSISPSIIQHHSQEESQNNELLRKVRGLLNKITSANFQKLSGAVMEFDLNKKTILLGVIQLLIEKAGEVPKYSHMYAQLCKDLSVKSPNFGKFLLNECNERFMNRSKINQTVDVEYQQIIIKQKMIGTHKFIGELYMLDMLSDKWVHSCIQHLLDLNRNESFKNRCDDMEYLCSLIGACGTKLETDEMKFRMDQYFKEIEIYSSESQHFPLSIRFMLCDVIDLRNSHWIPRVVEKLAVVSRNRNQQKNKPKPHKLVEKKSSSNIQHVAKELSNLSSVTDSSHRDGQNKHGKKNDKQDENLSSSNLLSYATNHSRIRL